MAESIVLDQNGLAVTLASGVEVELRLPFENEGDSPMRFIGRLSGPGAAFASVEGAPYGVSGHGRGAVVAKFGFPAAPSGRYELSVEVMDEDGYVVEPPGKRTVTLIVEGTAVAVPVEPAPAPEPVKAVEPEPVVEPAPVVVPEPKPKAPPKKKAMPVPPPAEPTPQPVAEVPVAAEPALSVPPEPEPVAPVVEEPPKPAIEPPKPVEEAPKPAVTPPKPRVVVEMPKPEPPPVAEPPKPEPTVVTFKRETQPEPVVESRPLPSRRSKRLSREPSSRWEIRRNLPPNAPPAPSAASRPTTPRSTARSCAPRRPATFSNWPPAAAPSSCSTSRTRARTKAPTS